MANAVGESCEPGGAFALHCRGDVRLYCGKDDCTPKSKKARALLAILAAEQRPLSRVKIIDLLWSDRQEEQARASLRTLLADLREQFGSRFEELLVVDRERVALGPKVLSDFGSTSGGQRGELFGGLDHLDSELDAWLRIERQRAPAMLGSSAPDFRPLASHARRWDHIAIGLGVLVLLLLASALSSGGGRHSATQTIAVLPLAGASNDAQLLFGEYLMQGIREGLRAGNGAHVLGEGTSRQLGGGDGDPKNLKQRFGVDLVLAASVKRVEGMDRIVARLSDASSGSELWSAQYRVEPGKVIESRDQIMRDLLERVRNSLSLGSANRNLAKWYEGAPGQTLAEARRLILLNRPEEALKARRMLLDLVAAHPDNVPALAALGEATMAAADHPYVGGSLPTAEAREEARAYSNRAIRLAPNAADGYAALGASYMETAQAIAPLARAVALEPGNYLYRTRLGRALEFEDRYPEAYAHQRAAVRLEPLAALPMINLIRAANELNLDADIRREIAAFAARRPNAATLGYVRAYYAFLQDDNVACVRNFRAVPLSEVDPQQRNVLLFCLTALGENAAALRLVADEDSLRRDVLIGDADLVEGRVRKLGPDFWRRHYESLAAAELLVNNNRSEFLLQQFDAHYNSVDDFIREGGFLTLYPQPLLVAMRRAGRIGEARKLRNQLAIVMQSARQRQGGDHWESYNGASLAMVDGERARAVRLLERCAPTCLFTVLQRDVSETALFAPLTGDPRFNALIRSYRTMINGQRRQLGLAPLPLS